MSKRNWHLCLSFFTVLVFTHLRNRKSIFRGLFDEEIVEIKPIIYRGITPHKIKP